jgi:hypothetical protein
MAQLRKVGFGTVVFTHIDEHGTVRHFDIDYLTALVEREVAAGNMEVVPVAVEEQGALVVLTERGMDRHRFMRLMRSIPQDGIRSPLLFAADVSPGTHLLVDGTHRYYAAFTLRMDTVPAVLLPKEVWESALVDASDFMGPDLTAEDLLATPSFIH